MTERHAELSFTMYMCMQQTDDSTVMSNCLSRCICACIQQMKVPSCRVIFLNVFLHATKRWQDRFVKLSFTMYLCMHLTD